MTRRALFWFCTLIFAVALAGTAQARFQEPSDPDTALVAVPLPAEKVEALERFEGTGLPVYARLHGREGHYILTGADPSGLQALVASGLSARVLDPDVEGATYYLAYPMPGRPRPEWRDYYPGRVLLDDGVQVLLRISPDRAERLAKAGVRLRALTRDPKPLRPRAGGRTLPDAVELDPAVQSIIDQVDSSVVYSYTGNLSGEWPVELKGQPYTIRTRYTYSGEPLEKATQFVGSHLGALGLNVMYHSWDADLPPNVIGELQGQTNPDDIFIICGHLDDMPSGSTAPGADDNASGSVAVLIAADILSRYEWDCTLRFALWTGEEQGLLGSEAYAEQAYNNGENIVGVLNLDMIAWNTPGSSPDIDLHADSDMPATMDLAQLFADVVEVYGLDLIPEIKPNGSGASDHASFWDYGYTSILGIEDFGDFNPNYHTTEDLLENLDMDYYTEFVKASLGTFVHMSGCLIPSGLGYLDGHVTAADDGAPIADATVTMVDVGGYAFSTTTESDGYYTATLFAGTFTVTASAFGHYPATVSNVVVVTDSVTTQDFVLDVTPTYVVSGTVVEAGTAGVPLLAQVTVPGTPLPPVWTDPATGFYSVTLPVGTYTLHVAAASYHSQAREIVVDRDQTQNFALQPLACLLLVDDDQDDPDVRSYYTAALNALGTDYDLWDVSSAGPPGAEDLMGYCAVLWFTGDTSDDVFTPQDEAAVSAYLDTGGDFVLSSQEYLYDAGLTAFGRNYLHIASYVDDRGHDTVTGVNLYSRLGPYQLSFPAANRSDQVEPDSQAGVAFIGDKGNAATVYAGDFNAVFVGFPLEAIPEVNDRANVLAASLAFFDCCACTPLEGAGFDWSPSAPVGGQEVSFSGTVALASPPVAYGWDFGDGETATGTSVTHVFTPAAKYTVWMTAINCGGQGTSVVSRTVAVAEPSPCEGVAGADFDWSPQEPVENETVSFAGSVAAGDTPVTYNWDFGDGQNAMGVNVTHAFSLAAAHTVWMTATNCGGDGLSVISHTVDVAATPVCTPVTGVELSVVSTGSLQINREVTFRADVAPDDAHIPYTYTVSVDGETIVPPGPGDANPLLFQHTFGTGGPHAVEIAVWNCEMVEPARDSLELTVASRGSLYLPVVLKGHTAP